MGLEPVQPEVLQCVQHHPGEGCPCRSILFMKTNLPAEHLLNWGLFSVISMLTCDQTGCSCLMMAHVIWWVQQNMFAFCQFSMHADSRLYPGGNFLLAQQVLTKGKYLVVCSTEICVVSDAQAFVCLHSGQHYPQASLEEQFIWRHIYMLGLEWQQSSSTATGKSKHAHEALCTSIRHMLIIIEVWQTTVPCHSAWKIEKQ